MTNIFFNGKLIPETEPCILASDRGFLLGDGLFETIHIYQGKALFLADHWERLIHGAQVLQLPLSFNLQDLAANIEQLLQANQLTGKDAGVRLTLTRGPASRGLLPPQVPQPSLLITAVPFISDPTKKVGTAFISSIVRNECSPVANIKTINYVDNMLAQQEAAEQGADDALLLNTKGHLVEASTASLFIVRDDVLYTPPINDGALPGVTRKHILELARANNITALETSLSPEDLFQAQEAFLTGSLRGVKPLIRVSGQIIGPGQAGPVTLLLQKMWRDYIQYLMGQ